MLKAEPAGSMYRRCWIVAAAGAVILAALAAASADETCMSPYLPKIVGQEDYLYVWTEGVQGLGDGSDKLVTIGANPNLPNFGSVVSSASVGGRHQAHDCGFNDDRSQLWAGGLADDLIYLFNFKRDPARPIVERSFDSTAAGANATGRGAFYALPGRMLISTTPMHGPGKPELLQFSNAGKLVEAIRLPSGIHNVYDTRVNPRLNLMLTSSPGLELNSLPDALNSPEAKRAGAVVVWDLHARKVKQLLPVPGAPMSVRWATRPDHDWALTVTAASSKLWLIERQSGGTFAAEPIATIGDPAHPSMPVDLSISLADRVLFVVSALDGVCHVFDIEDVHHPRLIAQQKISEHLGTVSESWYGARVYFSSSFVGRGDSPGQEQFVKGFKWDGRRLEPLFSVDFAAQKLGRPHTMLLGQNRFYTNVLTPQEAFGSDYPPPMSSTLSPPSGATKKVTSAPRISALNSVNLDYVFGFNNFRPQYELPAASSYSLPVIAAPSDHPVIDSDGRATSIFALKRNKLAIVSFIYTSCTQMTGCPYTNVILERIDRILAAEPELSKHVALITVSFDPGRDKPKVMAAVRANHSPKSDWHFVTTADEAHVQPILADFGQPISKVLFPNRQWTGLFRHVLKVFLLDEHNRISNIYSTAFMNPALVVDDLRTLLHSDSRAASASH